MPCLVRYTVYKGVWCEKKVWLLRISATNQGQNRLAGKEWRSSKRSPQCRGFLDDISNKEAQFVVQSLKYVSLFLLSACRSYQGS